MRMVPTKLSVEFCQYMDSGFVTNADFVAGTEVAIRHPACHTSNALSYALVYTQICLKLVMYHVCIRW
ncbi:hypothetical protein Hanom_Chr12g01083361 [Helianthus anomalus]